MSEYGSGISFSTARMYDKERIKHAFMGELMCGEDENGFIYAPASKEECEKFILSAYDSAVYCAIQAIASTRATERFAKDVEAHDLTISEENMQKYHITRPRDKKQHYLYIGSIYSEYMNEELQKFDYEYENGEEDEQPLSDKETKAERVRIGEHIVNCWTGGEENEAIRSEKARRPVHENSEPQR